MIKNRLIKSAHTNLGMPKIGIKSAFKQFCNDYADEINNGNIPIYKKYGHGKNEVWFVTARQLLAKEVVLLNIELFKNIQNENKARLR